MYQYIYDSVYTLTLARPPTKRGKSLNLSETQLTDGTLVTHLVRTYRVSMNTGY